MNCDFLNCSYICNDNKLNTKYYNSNSKLYKLIDNKNIDYSTFTLEFAKNEINTTKNIIKKLFRFKLIYLLEEIINIVKNIFNNKLFDNFFVYQALNSLIPKTENDINDFNDIIYDKYNRSGYIIYINKYYIFQQFELNENTPLYYRNKFELNFLDNLGIYSMIKSNDKYKNIKNTKNTLETNIKYDFKTNESYYNNKPENDYIGIIDRNNKEDIFKLRTKKEKNIKKTWNWYTINKRSCM